MKIDSSIIDKYLGKESYSNHWVFNEIEPGKNSFTPPDESRAIEVENCRKHVVDICGNFTFLNNDLVHDIFDDISQALTQVNILLLVGAPSMYDAMVRQYQGEFYLIFNLISFSDYAKNGRLSDIVNGLLSHELIHVLINEKYPPKKFSYTDHLNYISFHEGFAHLLSYKEGILNYQPDNAVYKARFDSAKEKLLHASKEKDPILRQKYYIEVNTGGYWDKFGAIASKLYLMKHMNALKKIYNEGWNNYINKIANYDWHESLT